MASGEKKLTLDGDIGYALSAAVSVLQLSRMSTLAPGPQSIVTTLLLAALWFGGACSTSESELSPLSNTGGTSNASSGGATSTSVVVNGSGGSANVTIDTSSAGTGATVTQAVECAEGATDCTCPTLSVAVIGKPGKWGANPAGDSDTAFQQWLNSSSAGTAHADVYSTRTPLTAELLAKYNVIILASLGDDSNTGPFWTFTDTEVAAFQDWIQNKAGGVITLIGYSGDPAEVKPVNQLLAFSGVSYNTDGVFATCTDWRICGCAQSNTLTAWLKSDSVIANLSNSVTAVGFQNGRSISAPSDAHVAATVSGNNGVAANALVGKISGTGRVLMYGDEWITYTSQWTGEGVNPSNCTAGYYPQEVYQTAQFWFNMIKWVQPKATCFKIINEAQPVTIW